MYLKALEIQGFKSFADKTRLTFEKDITAIVGPNGSGKSNISDAVLWVMGEQRTKALRGSKMEDVIFGGTEKRGALGYAQVSLIIDNSAHIFDSDSSEIMLTRRYYRSGDSEYYINNEAVRLKDINNLLMDTGLGRDGYSIIGQGKIADIVSTKSSDRREVFEEAAGISRYRYRKEEAERKLEKTEENLLRINDKIEELEMQVGPLKRQSEVAKRYLNLRDQLKIKEISLWMANLDKLREQSQNVETEYQQAAARLDEAKRSLEALYSSSDNLGERMHQKDVESERTRSALSALEGQRSQISSSVAVMDANIQSAEESMRRLIDDINQQDSRTREIEENIAAGQGRINELEKNIAALNKDIISNNNVLDGCKMKLASREAALNQVSDKASKLQVDLRSADSKIAMLTEMEKNLEGYNNAVKTVMREKERGRLKGVHGPVANLLRADGEYALAIETALGGTAQNIVVDSMAVGTSGIELLKQQDAGRATFDALDTVKGFVMRDAPVNDPGFVGIAYELVDFDERYDGIMAKYLGNTVVAEALSDAVRISKKSGHKYKIVTLDGQLVNAGGSMTGGSAARKSGILSRANELESLKRQRIKLLEKEKAAGEELDKAKANLAAVKYQLDLATEDQSALRSKSSSLEAEKRATAESVNQLKKLLDSLSGNSETQKATLRAHRRQIDDFTLRREEKAAELGEIDEKIKALKDEINQIGLKKLELEGKRTQNEKEAQRRNEEILSLERQCSKIDQKRTASQMEEKQILDKLWDNYELSRTNANELRQEVPNIQKAAKEINDIRGEISSLGNPNLGAIDEYERVNTRYKFLTEQRDDVDRAKAELQGIISDITQEMEEVFLRRFEQIDESFRQTFLELFGGGKAALVLEDKNDILNCGIDIKVQPPGKALSNISLLSGGEMAFVAIALYFAILKVRPTPFCVMDEIDAALDEANVNRYAQYMRRMADKTQFLIITHRRGTMEEADMLYGVTMQEKGVSAVIELDLESAQKTIEE